MALVLGCLLAFLFGALPWALIVVRAVKGIDVRSVGSGNVGATNASRAFATKGGRTLAFVGIYLLDAAKGFVPTWWGPQWIGSLEPVRDGVWMGAAAVLGHVFPPFLGFRGGKGVATVTGVLFALDWQVTSLAIAVFFVVRLVTGQVFLGSLALGLTLVVGAVTLHPENWLAARLPVTVLCWALSVLLFWTHRSNLRKHFAARRASRP